MNKHIKNILLNIENKGYRAYLVGGYVRDHLLNISSLDIDIATDMPYCELKEIFNTTSEFEEYNSIKFKVNEFDISITTYREELTYSNNKPVQIKYTSNIEKDSSRRDFTINAIYMDKEENIFDYYNGVKDLNNKIIRVVGNIKEKLDEDNTRILRAIRFMCVLDFNLDKDLNDYIIANKKLLNNINYNKKKYELDKIFKSKNYMKFFDYIEKNNLKEYFDIDYNSIGECENYLEVWSKLNGRDKYNFSKKEKEIINNYLNS